MATASLPIESVDQMMSMLPADYSEGATSSADTSTDIDTGDADETPEPDTTIDTLDEPPAIEEPEPIGPVVEPTEEEPEPQPEPPTPETPAVTEEELPEGARAGKDRQGKEGVFVTKDRWDNTIYASYKTAQQVAEAIGEPLTLEAIQLRNEAFLGQERLITAIKSGDQAEAANVVGWMLDHGIAAHQNGEVGTDPTVPIAQAFYQTLRDKSPDGYANLRFSAAKDLVGELFEHAARTNDPALFNATQHVVRMLSGVSSESLKQPNGVANLRAAAERMGLAFHLPEEMPSLARGADPNAQLRAENERLRAQVEGRTTSNQADQFNQWKSATNTAIATGQMDEAIKPALAPVADAWKDFPNEYQDLVVDRLQKKVDQTLAGDTPFKERIRILGVQAQRATNQAIRDRIAAEIRQAYVNRTKQAVEAHKRPVLEFAANWMKERSASTHARRQAAQTRTAPKGTTNPVPQSLIPNGVTKADFTTNGVFDVKKATASLSRFMPR
jgi:hypothetical protein